MNFFKKFVACAMSAAVIFSNGIYVNAQDTARKAGLAFTNAEHSPVFAKVELSQEVSVDDGLLTGANVAAYVGEETMPKPVEKSGKLCWTVENSSEQSNMFLYLNIDDFYLTNKNLSLICEIDYFDEGTGSFLIQYDAYNSVFTQGVYTNSTAQNLTNSGEWKTATIVIDNAYLMNRQAIKGAVGKDLPYKRMADMRVRAASGAVSISEIRVREAVEITGLSDKTGNIFTTQDLKSIPLKLYNSTGTDKNFNIVCNITDEKGTGLFSYEQVLTLADKKAAQAEIELPVSKKGVYSLNVTVVDSSNKEWAKEVIPFSVVAPKNGALSDKPYFGVQTHLVRKIFSENTDEVDKLLYVSELAGAEVMRDEMYWGMAEQKKDDFKALPHWDRYVETSIQNGIEPSLILSYGNESYRYEGEEGTPTPGTDEQIAAFANYARFIATRYNGKVKQYEIWNEWNGGMNNRPPNSTTARKYETDVYTRLMKATYTAIKSVDPDARVVGAVSAGANTFYVESIIALGGLDYMDAVSYHPYNYPSVPDRMSTEASTFEGLRKLRAVMKRYGVEKPLIISEQGWPAFTANQATNVAVPERYQAAYISRLFTLGLAHGAEQVIIYDLQDDGTYGAREQNFGMIQHWRGDEVPYAAKPSLVAMNASTEFLRGAEFCEEYVINQDLRAYRFARNADNKDVIVLWGVYNGHLLTLKGLTAQARAYDMYGNECSNTFVGTDPVYFVADKGTFDINELLTDRWYSVNADASHNIANMDAANGTYYYDSYLSSAPWYEGITLQTKGGMETPEFIVRGVRKGWKLGNKNFEDDTILADIDSSYMNQTSAGAEIRVEFFDEVAGEFYVWYDGTNGETFAGAVPTTGSKQWKEATFKINDAFFGNRLNETDIKLSIKKDDLYGVESLVFARIEVERTDVSYSADSSYGLDLQDKEAHTFNDNVSGKRALVLDTNEKSAKFDVDDKFIYGGETNIKLTIDYFDALSEAENHFFAVNYDNKSAGKVSLTGSDKWMQASFTISAAEFANLHENSDFIITLEDKGEVSGEKVHIGNVKLERLSPAKATAVLGETVNSSYLEPMPSGNAGFASTPSYFSEKLQKNVSTMRTNKSQSSPNLFLLVADDYLYDVNVTAELTVTFWDEGTGNLLVNYDGVNGKSVSANVNNAFTNSKDFKTIKVNLPKARFFSRGAQKSDITISRNNGDVAIAEVSIYVPELQSSFETEVLSSLPEREAVVDCAPLITEELMQTPESQTPESQAPESQAPESQAPESQAPESQTPESQAPESKAPESQAPESQTPESQAPETQKPESQETESQAPESQAPESQKPESQEPESQKPESQAPESQKPESQAPESQKPESQEPESQNPTPLAPSEEVPDKDKLPGINDANPDDKSKSDELRSIIIPYGCEINEMILMQSQSPEVRAITQPVEMDTQAPGIVTDLTARAVDSGVYLSWTNPEDGVSINATTGELRVYVKNDAGNYQLINYKMDSPANNPEGKLGMFYCGGLTNGKEYEFVVTVTDKWLNESAAQSVNATPQAGTLDISQLSITKKDDVYTASVQVTNSTSSAQFPILIIAAYDSENVMQELFTKPVLFMSDTISHNIELNIYTQDLKPHTKIKVFLWNNLNNMQPLSSVIEQTIN